MCRVSQCFPFIFYAVLKYHTQNINFTIMNIIPITVFILFFIYVRRVSLHIHIRQNGVKGSTKWNAWNKQRRKRTQNNENSKNSYVEMQRQIQYAEKYRICVLLLLFKLHTYPKGLKHSMWPITLYLVCDASLRSLYHFDYFIHTDYSTELDSYIFFPLRIFLSHCFYFNSQSRWYYKWIKHFRCAQQMV